MSNTVSPAGNAHLPDEELAGLRHSLEEQQQFRLEQLRRMAPPAASETATASTSEKDDAAHLEVAVKLAASARMVLTDVTAALERMAEGRYGLCELCTLPIDLPRLRIVPQARYCGRCQHIRDAER